ncbi:hypothetical protein G3576_29520 [Roseomonas stagni]|uniref:Uncharacterized protein n=1 Tax=Falsiroseomonas algicola TaxID=2716930 RepID=A0A6M1LVF8_9PROT|nr:hypothetical protein [Falsiroseomonas algicola]NGM24167.1 hypothetical protein [Falsiroseomonas algicola]
MSWEAGLVAKIWSQIDRPASYNWKLNPIARQRLVALSEKIDLASAPEDSSAFNRKLREIISPHLRGGNPDLRRSLIAWIIVEWGGIKRNHAAKLDGYAHRLKAFDDASIASFIASQGTEGVSSWSKVIALARPGEHAIYDARTAVALNCVLSHLGDQRAFAMPQSQSRVIRPAAIRLRTCRRKTHLQADWSGYIEYLQLLRAMVALPASTAPKSILDAEMQIFAVAPLIASEFLLTSTVQ